MPSHPLSVTAVNRPALEPVRKSRLRIVAVASAAYLAAFGAALWWGLGAGAADAWLCFAPAILAVALGLTAQTDRRQYVARLFAATMFLSIGLLMWAAAHERAGWWLAAALLAAVAAIFALLLWLARFTTRIEAARSTAPVSAQVLARRLCSLARPGESIAVTQGTAGRLCVDSREASAPERTHRVTLEIDERGREVWVREFLE